MGATVINSSEEMHAYRQKLEEAEIQLQDQVTKTERSLEEVSEGWKDEKFKEFCRNFEKDKETISSLCKIINEFHSDILYSFEQKLKGYEDKRPSL